MRIDSNDPLISRETHNQVLANGTDVPEQVPSFPIPLSEVGICDKTVWVQLPEGRLPFTAKMTVDLPARVRGIHMSRLEQTIADLYGESFIDLGDYGWQLAERMISRQKGEKARVRLTGKLPLLRQSKISRHLSVDPLEIEVEVSVARQEGGLKTTIKSGIGVCHITACPCTQVYNQDVFLSSRECPMPTHSQRSRTWLHLSGEGRVPSAGEMLDCLESALHVTQDLLKRPDEAEIVMKSHRYPQFAEDAVRETARAVGRRFGAGLPDSTGVCIESLSLESIHIHDVCCRLETTLGEILAHLDD